MFLKYMYIYIGFKNNIFIRSERKTWLHFSHNLIIKQIKALTIITKH